MNIKITMISKILKVLAGLAIIPVLALMVITMTAPESTKAA
ncbi:hypothetical protein ACFLXY_04740 [Chloroflexota bacterium]